MLDPWLVWLEDLPVATANHEAAHAHGWWSTRQIGMVMIEL
jgi:hypothetical protein